ncbi:MAG: methylated-DNA--[protein]-cysteine S-methyltransferase [Acidihalobacter sp.]|uniref:methylated-DNA--[protein]-cysteine S-methyltransferase n=1 Tax=Acidihalobacter sp. TaxID=1872108 RepID=UPI00307CEB6E
MNALVLHSERLTSPIGEVLILTDAEGRLRVVEFADHPDRLQRLLTRHYGAQGYRLVPATTPSPAGQALTAYFAGDLGALDAVQSVATNGTPFQREVWRALRDIPAGQTLSYGELASRLGRPKAVRAVGLANGANPIAMVVPCHRVIGVNGTLTGYGGGIERKRWLLRHEGMRVEGDRVGF